jgi:DNA helicase-2/ATP-dependent DNA helicase PcrA
MDLTSYNPEQLDCIITTDMNIHCVACAGSGKTRTIVGRNIYIIEQGLSSPSQMVAITFTEKAAGEMKERIYNKYEEVMGSTIGLAEMYIGTIHGFCLNQLQTYIPEYKKFEIITDVQRNLLVKRRLHPSYIANIPYYKIDGNIGQPLAGFKLADISLVLNSIDFTINELIDISELDAEIQSFYYAYLDLLSSRKLMDFTHVQKIYLDELSSNKILQEQVRMLKYLTVDEYQDTNTIQEAIIMKIKEINPVINLCVVGDDDQTLYEWRGSNLNVFRNFPHNVANTKTVKLTTNYRSSDGIVKVGENVARSIGELERISKEFKCDNTYSTENGDVIAQTDFDSITAENVFIINTIKKLKGTLLENKYGNTKAIDYSDMVILVDSTKNLRKFNIELLNMLEYNHIDYIIDGTKQLFDTYEIQLITDVFLLFASNYCNLALNNQIQFYNSDMIEKLKNHPTITTLFKKYSVNIEDRYEYTIQQFFLDLLDAFRFNLDENKREKELYNLAVFSNIISDFEKIYFLDTFSQRIRDFVYFIFYDAKDLYPEGWLSPKFTETKCLKIMTIYASKGLEFPVVFMPHLCEQFLFPSQPGSGKSKEGLFRNNNFIIDKLTNYKKNNDSYSRLFYVAVTRSMKYLIMTKAQEYFKNSARAFKKMPIQLQYVISSGQYVSNGKVLLNRNISLSSHIEESNEPLVFDFSTLKDIFECPKKFQFASVFGFNSPLNVRMGYGKSLHNMLDDIHRSYIQNKIIKNYDDLKSHLFLPLAPQNGELYRDMHTSAEKIVNDYTRINTPIFDYLQYVEAPIDYKLNDLVFINGRVDLIVNSESGDIKIIDFKSDSNVLSPDLRKKQLLIYALGYQKLTGKYPTSVISYDLKNNQPHEDNVHNHDLDQVESQINEAYKMIKSKNYPKCNNKVYCEKCNYGDLCKKLE